MFGCKMLRILSKIRKFILVVCDRCKTFDDVECRFDISDSLSSCYTGYVYKSTEYCLVSAASANAHFMGQEEDRRDTLAFTLIGLYDHINRTYRTNKCTNIFDSSQKTFY